MGTFYESEKHKQAGFKALNILTLSLKVYFSDAGVFLTCPHQLSGNQGQGPGETPVSRLCHRPPSTQLEGEGAVAEDGPGVFITFTGPEIGRQVPF